jgi:hypothetical protein
MGALLRLDLIRVDLPAMDIEPPFQTANLFLLFSSRGKKSMMCNLLGLTGTPKYLIGKLLI